MSLLGWNMSPDNSGECFVEPYDILATNDVWDFLIVRFGSNNAAQPTLRIALHGAVDVPQNYVGSPVIRIVWTATLTAGNVVWDFDYRAVGGDDVESLDQAGTQEAVTVTDAAPSAAHERNTPSVALTAANLAAGDTLEFTLFRDGTDAADTMAGSALLVGAYLEYSDA